MQLKRERPEYDAHQSSESFEIFPVDTGRKLNVHKTFRRRPGRLLNVLCTFNLRPVSTGLNITVSIKKNLVLTTVLTSFFVKKTLRIKVIIICVIFWLIIQIYYLLNVTKYMTKLNQNGIKQRVLDQTYKIVKTHS